MKKVISLWGFMGAGKSTVGQEFAKRFNWQWIDSDLKIEEEESCSIKEIFSNNGEAYFRRKESEFIQDLLNRMQESSGPDSLIITTGGGMPENIWNREKLKELGRTYYLYLPFEEIVRRLAEDQTRPLWNQNELNMMKERFERRQPYYREADVTIFTQGKTPEEIVQEIAKDLNL